MVAKFLDLVLDDNEGCGIICYYDTGLIFTFRGFRVPEKLFFLINHNNFRNVFIFFTPLLQIWNLIIVFLGCYRRFRRPLHIRQILRSFWFFAHIFSLHFLPLQIYILNLRKICCLPYEFENDINFDFR